MPVYFPRMTASNPVKAFTSMPLPDVFDGTAPVTMTVTFGPKGTPAHGTDGMRRPSPSLWREHNGMADFFD